MKMDHNFIEQQLLTIEPVRPRRLGGGHVVLVIAALLAAALAVANVPEPGPISMAADGTA